MKAAFIVNMDVDEAIDFNEVAADIADKLEAEFVIISVQPWSRKNFPTQKMSPRSQRVLKAWAAASAEGVKGPRTKN